jgi:hypothetical protein
MDHKFEYFSSADPIVDIKTLKKYSPVERYLAHCSCGADLYGTGLGDCINYWGIHVANESSDNVLKEEVRQLNRTNTVLWKLINTLNAEIANLIKEKNAKN